MACRLTLRAAEKELLYRDARGIDTPFLRALPDGASLQKTDAPLRLQQFAEIPLRLHCRRVPRHDYY